MYLTLINNSESNRMTVTAESGFFTVDPGASAEILFPSRKIEFSAKLSPFEVLTDAIDEMNAEVKKYKFKDKIIAKLTDKFAKVITDTVLNVELKYTVDLQGCENAVINLYDGVYSVCDGMFAEFLEMMPIMYSFCRAETECGTVNISDVTLLNRKKYLKFFRNCLLFANSSLIIVDWFFFIPSYLIIKFFASKFFVRRLMTRLYGKTVDERKKIIDKKEELYEKEDKGRGCLLTLLKLVIIFAVLALLVIWANSETGETL